jgi:hypothetical protein
MAKSESEMPVLTAFATSSPESGHKKSKPPQSPLQRGKNNWFMAAKL